MQRSLLLSIFLTVPWLTRADNAADGRVDDTNPLVQRNSRLHSGVEGKANKPLMPRDPNLTTWEGKSVVPEWQPPGAKASAEAKALAAEQPRAKKAYDTGKSFMDVVREMQQKWKAHKEQQMKDLEPYKYKKHMARKEAYRNKMKARAVSNGKLGTTLRADTVALNSTQRYVLENEAKIAKYGEQITLSVKDLLGHEFEIKFRTLTRMGVLMKVVCNKLGLKESEAKFVHRDRQLQPDETPGIFGLVDGDIIEVTTPGMAAAKIIKDEEDKKQAKAAHLRAKKEKEESKVRMARATKRMKKAKKAALEAAQSQRDTDTKRMGMSRVKFVLEGKPPVDLRIKRQNWLAGAMDLVCKRLELDRAKTIFLREVAGGTKKPKELHPKDTVDSLNLGWGEVIQVKTKPEKMQVKTV